MASELAALRADVGASGSVGKWTDRIPLGTERRALQRRSGPQRDHLILYLPIGVVAVIRSLHGDRFGGSVPALPLRGERRERFCLAGSECFAPTLPP